MINLRLIIGFVLAIGAFSLNASGAFLSEYGQIQNVANYSAMPGNKLTNSPYAANFPRPVYVQGTDLDTADCEQTVATLVAAYCSGVKNCIGMQLSDVRPILMVQLSRLPGHNYASACGGFIDSEFDRFISQYGNAAPQYRVAFPNATAPVNNSDDKFQIKNPYEIKLNDWQIDYLERANELEQLQAINGAGMESVIKADFPETFADLPFEQRMAILADGYQQYKDKSAYTAVDIEDMDTFLSRLKQMDKVQWCKFTNATECQNNTNSQTAQNNVLSGNVVNVLEADAVIDTIVSAMGAKTQEQEIFFTALVKDYVSKHSGNDGVFLDDAFVLEFLSEGQDLNLEKYKYALIQLEGETVLEKYHVNINWNYIKNAVADVLEGVYPKYGALVCENNRSWQVTIDTVGWVLTAVAAIFTAGAGGAAVAAGHAAIKTGLKAAAKAAVKEGAKKLVGKGVAGRVARILAVGGVVWTVGKGNAGEVLTNAYTFINSDATTDVITCKDLDHNEGCYTVCGDSKNPNDDLNTKVFNPLLGKNYCVNSKDYMMYEMKQDGNIGRVMSFD
ncbi:MAG: hypothetical protein ACLRFJ_02870, partial [Alphaproteobacteria bacterium]